MNKLSVSALLVIMLTALSAASDDVPTRVTPTLLTTEVARAAVRAGDPAEGRQAFIDLRCSRCHRVEGDQRIRRDDCIPVAPMLSFTGAGPQTIAGAIVARSPVGDSWVEADESGMSDSTSRMTVRQLANIIEYLRAEK